MPNIEDIQFFKFECYHTLRNILEIYFNFLIPEPARSTCVGYTSSSRVFNGEDQ